MAWNEPGGTGNKDPWGSRKNDQQGPPDLDEMLRKIKQKLNALFGGSGRADNSVGGSDGGDFRASRSTAGFIALAVLVVWGLTGIYIVDPAEKGVVLRFGKYVYTTESGPHWHIPYPVESVQTVNVDQINNVEIGFRSDGLKQTGEPVAREALMLTQDENIIDIRFSVQYRIKDARDYLFNVRDPDVTLAQATESAVREIIGKSSMDFVLTEGRSEITAQAEQLTQAIVDRYQTGLQITSVNMQNAQPPEEVQDAFQDAVRAISDQQRLINEAETYANGVVPEARGNAARITAEANAYKSKVIQDAKGETARFLQVLAQYQIAPAITRERIYLEAMESVLARTGKVLMDVKGGNNLLYLPLEQMLQQRSGTMDANASVSSSQQAPVSSVSSGAASLPLPGAVDSARGRSRGER